MDGENRVQYCPQNVLQSAIVGVFLGGGVLTEEQKASLEPLLSSGKHSELQVQRTALQHCMHAY